MRNEHKAIIAGAGAAAVVNPALAPIAVPMMIGAVRHAAWEQSQAIAANNEINSLRNQIIQGIAANGSKRYVPDGVMLVCSTGTTPAKLVVTSQSAVKIASGKLMATLPDRMDCNLNCIKMVLAGAVIGAIAAAVVVAAVVLSGGTLGVVAAMAIGAAGATVGAGAGQLASMIPCICGMLTSAPWIPVHPTTKIGGNMALVETSQLACFLGGTVSIFYSPEAAQMVADKNSKTMWFDLGLTVLGGAVLGATAAGVGALIYGGSVAYSAAATGAKLKAIGAYVAAAGTKLVALGSISWFISEGKDLVYEQIPVTTSQGKVNFKILRDGAYEDEENKRLLSDDEKYGKEFKENQETTTNITSNDAGEAGGVYRRNSNDPNASYGAWDSDHFVRAATNPTVGDYGKLMKEQAWAGVKESRNPLSKSNRKWTGLDIITDGIKVLRNYMIIEDGRKIDTKGKTLEDEAKKGVKVTENNI